MSPLSSTFEPMPTTVEACKAFPRPWPVLRKTAETSPLSMSASMTSPRRAVLLQSPRQSVQLQHMGSRSSLESTEPSGRIRRMSLPPSQTGPCCLRRQLSQPQFDPPCRLRRASVPSAADSEMVSVTARVPRGSSVSVSVTTSQTVQHTQTVHLMAR